ncbi:MAG: hypothetical protein RLY43_1323, partial [Bacteroidota bacterium]
TASIDTDILEKLQNTNYQIASYFWIAKYIAIKLNLKLEKFQGVLYIQNKKPMAKMKENESKEEYLARLNTEVNVLHIPNVENALINNFLKNARNIQKVRNRIRKSFNFSNCYEFNTKCQYFKQCHKNEEIIKTKHRN